MSEVVREWTLHEEIGRGGMGVVYRATHRFMRGEWAIKVIRPELTEDREACERFLSEVMLLSDLRHPKIVQIQTPFEENGRLYLPMELLVGHSLDRKLKADSGPLFSTEAAGIALQIAVALGYAHSRNPSVLHRDIKPGNIFVLRDGGIKLLDFGLARTLVDKSITEEGNECMPGEMSITVAGKVVGTPAYMAPEILDGKKATAASDVWALGMVLYRMLAGRLPYDVPEDESSIHVLFMAIARGIDRGLPDVREFVSTVPSGLADLTMRALSRDPQHRPSDGVEFASLLKGLPVRSKSVDSEGRSGGYEADRTAMAIDLESVKRPAVPVRSARPVGSAEPLSSGKVASISADRSMLDLDPEAVRKADDVKSFEGIADSPSRVRKSGFVKWLAGFLILLFGFSSGIWWLAYQIPRQEVERQEVALLELERQEAARLEAERQEVARLEAERQEVARLEAERQEVARLEAERQEVARLEAERQEVARLEAERQEAERLEAERQDVSHNENVSSLDYGELLKLQLELSKLSSVYRQDATIQGAPPGWDAQRKSLLDRGKYWLDRVSEANLTETTNQKPVGKESARQKAARERKEIEYLAAPLLEKWICCSSLSELLKNPELSEKYWKLWSAGKCDGRCLGSGKGPLTGP